MSLLNRRSFLIASAACAASCGEAAAPRRDSTLWDDPAFRKIWISLGPGGRLGVMALDTGSGRRVAFNADGRFAMCSTFKFPLAAFVLRLAERGLLSLTEQLKFGPGNPLDNSPVTEANLKRGGLPVEMLAAAIVQRSDNSAANLLLHRVGGPSALTRFIRACGDSVTRFDRYEMALNSNIPGDERDTTTPAAMADLTNTLLLGDLLSRSSRDKLVNWLITSVAKPDRLKAGFPKVWRVGHKPGTGRGGAVNDVAIAWPPGKPPIIVSAFLSGGTVDAEARAAAHRAIAALVARRFA